MRKAIIALIALTVILSTNAYAIQNSFMDMRTEIVEESKKVKELLGKSKDSIAISSIWDTCLITISQIDAYFNLLGLFNSVPEKYLSQESAEYLIKWMGEIRKTNDLNIKMLGQTATIADGTTQLHMQTLKDYFTRLNTKIESEVININTIKAAMKKNAAN